ncbi:hypothetical protein EVAR_26530_1 [Eumeta japonica]|uniref:Uncharacterized protein n=1 Tax=Eumeta variegata TaxID=151549 RepID=A0A4C1V8B6_EUMVA|nr:hypothetical protein EVAR_26530_1 [Eumeta japonica]
MNKDGGGFQYLKTKFPQISDAKMKEGIFVGPQIRELMKDSNFESTLNEAEQRAWTAFVEWFTDTEGAVAAYGKAGEATPKCE